MAQGNFVHEEFTGKR